MNKQAKKDLMFSMITAFVLICSVFVMGSGETNDVPSVTIVSPTVLSTIEDRQGWLNVTVDATIPSGDADSNLVNASLYLNITPNINHTWFIDPFDKSIPGNYSVGNSSYVWNQTIIFNGTSNQTNFLSEVNLTIGDGDYVNWQVVVCNQQGNCTYTTNTSTLMDRTYDTTVPYGAINSPSNASVYSNKTGRMELNFTATDDVYVQNVTLYLNYSAVFNGTACDSYLTIAKNETLQNTGATSPFFSNTLNTTIVGNFTNAFLTGDYGGDGFYCAFTETKDYNNLVYNSTIIYWEVDNTKGRVMNFLNTTLDNTCSTKEFKFNVSEPSNVSIYYGEGENSSAWSGYVSSTAFVNGSHIFNLTGLRSHKTVYYNITICDESSNCNKTAHDEVGNSFLKEYSACAGWNAYGVLDDQDSLKNATRLQNIATNVSDSTTISYWNRSDQAWVNYVVGVSTNQNWSLSRGEAVFIYTENDSVITQGGSFMETSYTEFGNWSVNMSGSQSGVDGNWTLTGILQDWTMGNITANTGLKDNITVVSYYNNSLAGYQDHIWGYSINNNTELGAGDTLWLWAKPNHLVWYRNVTVSVA